MIPRGPLIAVLIVIELAILGGMVRAVQGGATPWTPPSFQMGSSAGPDLVEDGPHRLFDVGEHPELAIDIGYADLTIVAGGPSQIDVSVSDSNDFGLMRDTSRITARQDGATVRIGKSGSKGFSIGDDRMVTVVVPPQTQVTVTNAGDIKVTGLRGVASINSVGNGHIIVDDYDGPSLNVSASNGRIELQRVIATRIDASSDDGRVEGTGLQVHDGTIESNNGRVTLGFAPGSDTVVNAETSNGSVRVSGFASAAAPAVHNSDDDDDTPSARTVRIGAGTGRLDVHSSDGNITLNQEG
jgi:hypothetical protein